MSRGNAKQKIFRDDEDYQRYLTLLASTAARFNVRSLGYCLMSNHLHLLLRPGEIPLSRMLQQLNSSYCGWFNRRHGRVGHTLAGRPKMILVDSGSYLRCAVAYVLRNPLAAGYVESAGDWPWSSYRALFGRAPVPDFLDLPYLWRVFDPDSPTTARRRLAAMVAAPPEEHLPLEAWLFGSRNFARACTPLLEPHRWSEDFIYGHRFADRPDLPELLDDPTGGSVAERVRRAFLEQGYTLREIGAHLGRPACTVWAWIRRHGNGRRPRAHASDRSGTQASGNPDTNSGSDLDFLPRVAVSKIEI